MKATLGILCFLFALLMSCSKEINPGFGVNCDLLRSGIIKSDSKTIGIEISKLIEDLTPTSTIDDNIGHAANFDELENRIHKCGISCQIICYCCIYPTNPIDDPLISQIFISTLSGNKEILQVIDIITPRDGNLEYKSIHQDK
jgi:hypothetical protein